MLLGNGVERLGRLRLRTPRPRTESPRDDARHQGKAGRCAATAGDERQDGARGETQAEEPREADATDHQPFVVLGR